MNRKPYIYLLLPLCTALSFVGSAQRLLGTCAGMALTGLVCLALWALVWLRLYGHGKVRPEFAVLGVLPPVCYMLLNAAEGEVRATFSTPAWQNLYFLVWLAGAVILILSLLRCPCDGETRKWTHDATLHICTIFIILYTVWTWASTAALLFPL